VGEAFNILGKGDDLLEVLILAIAKDGVVYDYAIDFLIVVCVYEGVFKELAVDLSKLESEATETGSAYGSTVFERASRGRRLKNR
jgi:hypothetical protein